MMKTGDPKKIDKLIKQYINCFKKAGHYKTRDWEIKYISPCEISIEESFKSFRGSVNLDETEILWSYFGDSEIELHFVTISFILSELEKLNNKNYRGYVSDNWRL